MGNKVFTQQLTAVLLGTAVLFLSACSEVIELPDTATVQTPQVTEQNTSLAAPITIDTSASGTTEPTVPTPEPVVTQPEPTPEPVVTEPEPTPEPIITQPEPTPEPVVTQPEPTPEPVVVTEPATEPTKNIWQPTPGTSWQWQLTGKLDISLDVAMYDIDLFDTPQSTIDQLHADGRIVICYFSAGSLEPWRTDAKDFPQEVIGKKMSGWDEYWLDISNLDALKSIITKRLDLAAEKKCDGVEPDNVDAYQNDSGFPLIGQDQLTYNIFLAEEAHKRGLSVGLKNSVELVEELEPYFDWALNESCFQWNECEMLKPFIDNNKAVFGVEYTASTNEFCNLMNGLNYDFLKKDYDLSAKVEACRN